MPKITVGGGPSNGDVPEEVAPEAEKADASPVPEPVPETVAVKTQKKAVK